MSVRQLNLDSRSDRNKFIQFPFDHYQKNRYWVPQMRAELRAVLNKETHPFYQHSQADFFISEQDGKVNGRIAVITNNRANAANKTKTAYFYFFESIDNPDISNALFSKVVDWSRERDLTQIYGPKGLLQGDGIGLLVKGFDYLPAVGISYNYPYYDKLVHLAGFSKKFDYFSGFVDTSIGLSEKVKRVAEKVKIRSGFWVREFTTKNELLETAPELREVYNSAFGGSEGFSPITENEIIVIAKRLLSIADPRLIKLVYHGNKVIGFLFTYPNISRGLQKTNGRMYPFGWIHLLRDFKRTKYLDANGIGILPEYQGLGSTAVIYTELEKTFREFKYEHVETVQVREDNHGSLGESRNFKMDWAKTHRVYEMDL